MSELFLEKSTVVSAGAPKDLNTSAFAGSRIKLDKGYKLAVVVHMGDSTGAVVSFDLDQHDAASAGNSKALNIQSNYYHKIASANAAFTKVEARPDDASLSDAAVLSTEYAAEPCVVVFHILPEHLDLENGFAWASLNIADSTAAKIASVEYIVSDIKNGFGYEQAI